MRSSSNEIAPRADFAASVYNTDITKEPPPFTSLDDRSAGVWSRFSFAERALTLVVGLIAVLSGLSFLSRVTTAMTVETPARGGNIIEGIVGTPRFINPLLAQSDADQDLVMLTFSGLMRALPDGTLSTDLASGYSVSEDGTTYTVTIRPDAYFHDGAPVTASDVLFTIERAQDPIVGSPYEDVWTGIGVDMLDEHTVQFTLSQPYASFLENLTIGIIPRHLWISIPPEEFGAHALNTEPVGAGPFMFHSVKRNRSGIPTVYELRAYDKSTRGRPHIDSIEVHVFGNQKELLSAFAEGDIESFDGLDPADASVLRDQGISLASYDLPRIFGIFFNQNKNDALTSSNVRKALDLAVNKERIVADVLFGFGEVTNGPVPPHLYTDDTERMNQEDRLTRARELLENAGWEMGESGLYEKGGSPLRVSIATANTPELKRIGELIKTDWLALGADASIELFDIGQLHREIIRPRAYEALLFGQVIGRDGDVYPFWHSSQRNDPGLNIALYANIESDAMLEDIRATLDLESRKDLYASFAEEVQTDTPAIFLYMPHLLYVVPENVSGMTIGVVRGPAERFLDVHEWYTRTQRVWKVFAPEQ